VPDPTRERAIALLGLDPLRHIVGLKMLERVGAAADVHVREDASGWAALITFESSAVEYDAQNYGSAARIAVLEGSSEALELALFEELGSLARCEGRALILKTQRASIVARAARGRSVATFLSFTTREARRSGSVIGSNGVTAGDITAGDITADSRVGGAVASGSSLSPELAALFDRNGYRAPELDRHFADGARWFAIYRDGAPAVVCFVFRNFGPVWEIAGVHSVPAARRQGLATRVVRAAIVHLLDRGALPRYQTSAANEGSVALARGIGLVEFLRIEHVAFEAIASEPRVR